jgi:cytoskeletal protein CcmA (bactofilin family)
MGLFDNNSKQPGVKPEVPQSTPFVAPKSVDINEVSRLALGAVFKGDLATDHDIRIDGTFEGRLFCGSRVVVGEKAVVNGEIYSNVIDFGGTMRQGKFYVKDTLTLQSGCKVTGDLFFHRLQVEIGAYYTGSCQMIGDNEYNQAASSVKTQLQSSIVSNPKSNVNIK